VWPGSDPVAQGLRGSVTAEHSSDWVAYPDDTVGDVFDW
jgi:hypothetical protein